MELRFRRGDIVWTRVEFPKKWWPGLIRSIDGHRIAVSFFNDSEDSRVFLETEVFSFEGNFDSLSKTIENCSRGQELLDSALNLLARRAACRFKCPCHFRCSSRAGEGNSKWRSRRDVFVFRPDELLSLVHGLAVSPFVGDSDFVSAVTMASQLHVFRGYLVAERKVFLQHLQNSPLPITGACSVAQSSDVSKLAFESLNVDQPNSGKGCKASVENRYCLPSSARGGNYNVRVEADRLESSNAAFSFRESSTESKLHLPAVASNVLSSMPPVTQQPSHSIQMEHSICIDRHKISVVNSRQDNINEAFSSMLKLLLPLVTSDARSSMPREAQQSQNAIQMDHSRDNHNMSVENNRQDGINAAFSSTGSSMKNLRLPLVTSDVPSCMPREAQQSENTIHMDHSRNNHKISFETTRRESITEKRPKVDEQSTHTMYGSCQFLYMKFPRDFNLPSKKDLVRTFRKFGKIDLVRTKLSERLGSAQVVFLHCLDALVAYQYAKKNKDLFRGSTVLFWLDPHEKKRNLSKLLAPMPKLKSCLKSPHSGGQEDKKRSRKVRFRMQSS